VGAQGHQASIAAESPAGEVSGHGNWGYVALGVYALPTGSQAISGGVCNALNYSSC
jgi:hypothetical protein